MNVKPSLVFIENFGKLSFCCPLGKADPNRNGILGSKLRLLPPILWYTFVILIYVNSRKESTGSIPLSGKIAYSIMAVTMLVSDTLLRLPGVFHGSGMLRLLYTCKQRASNLSRLDLRQIAVLAVAGGIAVFAFTGIVHLSIAVHFVQGVLPLLSDSKGPNMSRIIRRILYMFADYSAATSIAFSVLFVAVIGLILLRWLETWQTSASLLSQTEHNGETLKTIQVFGIKETAARSLHQEFLEIRASFEIYGKIAGIFSLGIIIDCTMNCINVLTMMIPSKDDLEGNIDNYYSFFNHVRLIPMLIFICCFGNFIGNQIRMHRRKLRELEIDYGHRVNASVAKTLNFVNEWTWKLTACDLFDINHALLPTILATIMTYFIFLFQLKSSEATCV